MVGLQCCRRSFARKTTPALCDQRATRLLVAPARGGITGLNAGRGAHRLQAVPRLWYAGSPTPTEPIAQVTIDIDGAVRRIHEDGYAVVPDFLDEATVERLRRGLAPVFDAIGSRMTEDHGQQTIHTHNLLAKTRAVDEVLVDDRLLALIEAILGPDFQLSGVAAMRPGAG